MSWNTLVNHKTRWYGPWPDLRNMESPKTTKPLYSEFLHFVVLWYVNIPSSFRPIAVTVKSTGIYHQPSGCPPPTPVPDHRGPTLKVSLVSYSSPGPHSSEPTAFWSYDRLTSFDTPRPLSFSYAPSTPQWPSNPSEHPPSETYGLLLKTKCNIWVQ